MPVASRNYCAWAGIVSFIQSLPAAKSLTPNRTMFAFNSDAENHPLGVGIDGKIRAQQLVCSIFVLLVGHTHLRAHWA